MTPRARPPLRRHTAALVAALGVAAAVLACEKETHRAARADFQALMARNLPPEDQARALEAFVARYPEPKTNPYLIRAFMLLADEQARAGQSDIAASWYERAVRASPNDPDLLNALGYLYASHGMNLDRAVSVLESAVRLAEERGYPARRQGFIKDSLGWAYRMRGDLPLAVALLEEACRLAPGVTVLRAHLADAYRAIGEREKAATVDLELYLEGRATDKELRQTLSEIGREGGPALSREIARRLDLGLRAMAESDRREAEEDGGHLVRLEAADGTRLQASLFLPGPAAPRGAAGAPRRAAGVLLLHALGSSRRAAAGEARALAARGLVAMTLDLRGHGGSVSETLPGPHRFVEGLDANLIAAEQDALAALAHLRRLPRVDAARLGLVGAGLGALLAVRALDDAGPLRASALAIVSPWGQADAYRGHLARLAPGVFLLVSGSEESSASSTIQRLTEHLGAAAATPIIVPGPGSGYELAAHDPTLDDRIASFLAKRLQ